MINQIQEDLSKELNCNPKDIKLVDEKFVDGFRVRRMLYKDKGFKVTTDSADSAYINIEPFTPNQKPIKVVIDTTPAPAQVKKNIMNNFKKLSPGLWLAIVSGVAAVIYVLN